jgi:hypothetical protein
MAALPQLKRSAQGRLASAQQWRKAGSHRSKGAQVVWCGSGLHTASQGNAALQMPQQEPEIKHICLTFALILRASMLSGPSLLASLNPQAAVHSQTKNFAGGEANHCLMLAWYRFCLSSYCKNRQAGAGASTKPAPAALPRWASAARCLQKSGPVHVTESSFFNLVSPSAVLAPQPSLN